MNIADMIAAAEQRVAAAEARAAAARAAREAVLAEATALGATNLTEDQQARFDAHTGEETAARSELPALTAKVDELRAIAAADAVATADAAVSAPTGAQVERSGVVTVRSEPRTYTAETDKRGSQFLADVGRALLGDQDATQRLNRHRAEERVERPGWTERAAGTGAFAGLTVPQYLTDMYAPAAKANRPFADACNKHDLPDSGMTVNLSRITTATSAGVQASENAAVAEQNIDDTLLSIPVQTIAGQQTLSRQAIERGTGIEGAMLDDLFRSYATTLDSTLLNQATTGLTNVASAVTYTDASPTAAELYPKLLQSIAAVEAALLDQDPGDTIAVMHSRRWYWLQSQVGSSWPFVQQPGIAPQMGIANLAERYGAGVRGVLPNGTAVIVDNNIATNLGAGTNEDEIYIGSSREFHLWEDASAPMMIRAEQTAAASLGVLFVVYGYVAYTHARYTHSQKVSGTGLVAPTFA